MRGAGGNVKEKISKGGAWSAQVFAVAAGAALTITIVGVAVTAIVAFLPPWITVPAFIGGLGWAGWDLLTDGIPNRPALYIAMVLPSWALGLNGVLAAKVREWSGMLLDRIDDKFGEWTGASSALTLAVSLVVACLVTARRTVAGR